MSTSFTIICPVTRKVACESGAYVEVLGELVNWSGVSLVVHRHIHAGKILGTPEWTCSHEPTGWAAGHGPSPETALASAIEKIRRNWETFQAKVRELPVLNP